MTMSSVTEIVKKVRPHIEAVAFHCYEGDYKAPGALNQVYNIKITTCLAPRAKDIFYVVGLFHDYVDFCGDHLSEEKIVQQNATS